MNLNNAIQMAAKFANQKQFAQAEKVCRDIISANDKYHPAYHLLSQLAFQSGRDDIAVQMLRRAVLLDGNRATYQRDLAEVLFYGGNPKDAVMFAKRALTLNPNDAKSHYISGMALNAVGDQGKAILAFKATIKIMPNHGPAYNNFGSILEIRGETKEAKKAYAKAVEINKSDVIALNNLASILISEGDVKTAKIHLATAINVRPGFIEAHHNLSALKKYKKSDVHIKHLELMAQNPSNLTMDNQIRLNFILGKAYGDIGDVDTAFDHYRSGNKMKRASFEYDEQAAVKFNDDVKKFFDKAYFNSFKKTNNDDLTPIFVVGMPRSGSSLIEQILSSHSDIHAGGELFTLIDTVKSKVKNFPQDIERLNDLELRIIGDEYLQNVKKLNPNAKRIVDKMPANFQYAGLIAKILPGAHIINTDRSPMDSCFSNYTRLFIQTIQYAYDLGELGRYYNRYQDLMEHWHRVLPRGKLLSVKYENVVADLEQEARKLIDFVGLDWQEECLEFHNNKSRVNTASAAQVRKPIYKTSIEKWRPYEKHLGPLIKALKET